MRLDPNLYLFYKVALFLPVQYLYSIYFYREDSSLEESKVSHLQHFLIPSFLNLPQKLILLLGHPRF